MEYQISVDIDAPSDVVWAVMSDGERWHGVDRVGDERPAGWTRGRCASAAAR